MKIIKLVKFTFPTQHKPHNAINKSNKVVLTVGDSFTFGDQVSDKDTWQSCLNDKESRYFFINGGVGGYGILQSILRAEELSSNNKKYLQIKIDFV